MMKLEPTVNNGISVLVEDSDVTLTNYTNVVSSSNLHHRENLRRLSVDNCHLIRENSLDEQTFGESNKTSDFSEASSDLCLSGNQNKSRVKIPTERRSSVGSNGNLYLNLSNHSIVPEIKRATKIDGRNDINAKDENSNLTHKCPADSIRSESLTSNVTMDVAQHQRDNSYHAINEDSFEDRIRNISCQVLRSSTGYLQDHEDTDSCALPNALRPELQMEQDVRPISEEPNHTPTSEGKYSTTNPEAVIKVQQECKKHLPDYIQALEEGRKVCGDSYVEFAKPHWLDEEKFRRGQHFARNHLFCIMVSDLISLMMLFAFPAGLGPLIFTGQSDTPFKAFKRYLSTNVRVNSWYDGDIFDTDSEAHKNLKAVRAMHESTRRRIISGKREDVAKKMSLEDRPMWTDLHEEVRQDFQRSCPVLDTNYRIPDEVCMSQGAMAVTQFGFFGLVLVCPKWFGVFDATDEDWDGFIHFWRTIAHLLGVEERFNLCNGDVVTVRQRCKDIIEHMVKPEFTRVSRDWMHMSRVMVQGVRFYIIGISFEVMLLYLCSVLNIKTKKLSLALTFRQRLQYINICFVMWFLMRLSFVLNFLNKVLRKEIEATLNMSPERVEKLKRKVFSYEKDAIAAMG